MNLDLKYRDDVSYHLHLTVECTESQRKVKWLRKLWSTDYSSFEVFSVKRKIICHLSKPAFSKYNFQFPNRVTRMFILAQKYLNILGMAETKGFLV